MKVGFDQLVHAGLMPGDVVFTTSKSFLSKAIRYFSTGRREKRTWASHCGVVVQSRLRHEPRLVEAVASGVKWNPIRNLSGDIVIVRAPDLSESQRTGIELAAFRRLNRKYGFGRLLVHMLDWIGKRLGILKDRFFTRKMGEESYIVCSQLVALAYKEGASISFGHEPQSVQPDDILDYAFEHEWELVWASSKEALDDLLEIYDGYVNESAT